MSEQNNQLPQSNHVFLTLLPGVLAIFIGFLIMGMQLPVLPVHLHDTRDQAR
ncbi:hypothetical protein QNH14_16405 [Apirhabdus apintestini]|nr:hypothetical protein QNH14_16405 [Enterobacteriaceae bacterium CA-0114]